MSVPGKPYSLSFDEKPKYLYAHIKSDGFTVEVAVDYLREVINECRELQYTRIMIERDVAIMLPAAKNTFVAEQLATMDVEGLRIAVVDPRPENRELNRFSAAASRGLGIKVRAYSNIPDARRWLLSD